jgi:hypothetical protein
MGISTAASAQKGLRRERQPDDDDDGDTYTVGDRERYRSRPRHRSTEPDPQMSQNLPPRLRSPLFPPSPDSDGPGSQRPTTTELASGSSPRRKLACHLDRDGPDQPALGCDETRMRPSPTRGEYHPAGVQLAHPQAHEFPRVRSSSIESVEERDEDPSPQSLPPSIQKKMTTLPTVPTASSSAPQLAPNSGNFGMLSDSELADETVHLRALLGCPPGAPVGLNALADPPPGEKPNYPLPTLIKLAIYGSPRRRLTLQEIYQALEDRFEWFRQRTDELSWKVRAQPVSVSFTFFLVLGERIVTRILELHSAQSVSPEVLLEGATAHHGTGQRQLLDDRPHAGRGQQTCEEAQQEADQGSTRRTGRRRRVPCFRAATWSR